MRNAGSYRAMRRNAARALANAKKQKLAAVWPSPAKPLDLTPPQRVNPSDHPGANPAHDPAGRKRWIAMASKIASHILGETLTKTFKRRA